MAHDQQDRKAVAARALGLLDLTSLNDDDDAAAVEALCTRARSPFGPVAAVCVWPRFVAQAKQLLHDSGIKVAAVANFPEGGDDMAAALRDTREIVAQGGDEVDLVMPYGRWLAGDRDFAQKMIAACKRACGDGARLKVILETGRLQDATRIYEASRDAIEAGADMIKTSTGKVEVSATLEAAEAMLRAIKDSGRDVGFKAAGGIRDTATAGDYLALADRIMGPDWADPWRFRFGASGVLNDLLAVLGDEAAPTGQQGY
ncbi:deoxyribose-phosphate aldolase [Pelagibius litoralis]|uniref:Deoxyribose-phosphate aldolase n=1 Tax=Pelagibius litoralis TaxID=374515 RepID=A0A967F0A7_9PROT|nr:deoxyribose-phosphate aldolase [Pelagibius litoralis]NIA70715.1 deoxyribose-phosphate aldolase [Pelagibius litoralis]